MKKTGFLLRACFCGWGRGQGFINETKAFRSVHSCPEMRFGHRLRSLFAAAKVVSIIFTMAA